MDKEDCSYANQQKGVQEVIVGFDLRDLLASAYLITGQVKLTRHSRRRALNSLPLRYLSSVLYTRVAPAERVALRSLERSAKEGRRKETR